ncbi:MAG: helix-turn-helix domain-containing protein [Alphaproteobacteria bacterium]|jgi:transcriptional regulator with XRE-family HTH domain|nr:helix-turn-helix domain-containing protein [Alphaproteobacteria bacterium]
MISVSQIKAARSLLGWRQEDLAKRSGLSLAAINKLERNVVSPRQFTFDLLRQTFEQEGVEFTDGPGVRLTDNIFVTQTFTGKEALPQLLDDIFATLKGHGGDVLLSGIDESLWADYAELVEMHQKRMSAYNIKSRALLCEGDVDVLPYIDIESYRWISKDLFTQLLYYVYADKFALVVWGNPIRITIIQNKLVADTFRRQFEMNWKNGKTVSRS